MVHRVSRALKRLGASCSRLLRSEATGLSSLPSGVAPCRRFGDPLTVALWGRGVQVGWAIADVDAVPVLPVP